MPLLLKSSVDLGLLRPQIVLAVYVAASVWDHLGVPDCVVTSANDSEHGGHPIAGEAKDPHYTGRAVDLRLNDVQPVERRLELANALRRALTDDYDVLHESPGTPNEHLHIQYKGEA